MFGKLDQWPPAPLRAGHDPAAVARLAGAMQAAWISFARSGQPHAAGLPESVAEWPRWTAEAKPCMVFDDAAGRASRVIHEAWLSGRAPPV